MFANGFHWLLSIYIVGVFVVDLTHSTTLPSFVKPCFRHDPERKACLVMEGRRVLKKFVSNLPNLGVESIDPLSLGNFNLNTERNMKLEVRGGFLKGLKDMRLADLDIDLERRTGKIKLLGNASFESDYTIDGRILLFPIKGKGKFDVDVFDLNLDISFNWDLVTLKDGKEHMVIDDAATEYDIGDADVEMTGLSTSDSSIGSAVNRIMSNNWRLLLGDIGPPVVEVIQKKIIRILNQFYAKIPFDDLLPVKYKEEKL